MLVALTSAASATVVGCGLLSGASKFEKVDGVETPGATPGTANDNPLPTSDDPSADGTDPTTGLPIPSSTSTPDDPPPADAGGDATADADAGDAGARCPGTAGPISVRIGGFCIDTTEVTKRDYAAFLAAKGTGAPNQAAPCNGNTSYVPTGAWPAAAGQETLPVVRVDWCDAKAYCEWAGKRLCGRIAGGALPNRNGTADATQSQWFAACSANGTKTYPYGNTFEAVCNGDNASTSTKPVASYPKCIGGASPLIFDMSGNVWEWEDACQGGGARDTCSTRGGGYTSGRNNLRCSSDDGKDRDESADDLGIRCCSP